MPGHSELAAQIRARVAAVVRPEVRALKAYPVAPSAGLIKLDAMENPYPWPAQMRRQWQNLLRGVEPNRYPDPAARRVRSGLYEVLGIPTHLDLLLGNGSDELIQLLILSLAGPGRTVLAPQPSFVMYRLLTEAIGARFVGVPLRADDFSLDVEAMLEAIERHQPALVFLACPNNPTGNLFARHEVLQILARAPGVVVVDEAYEPFARHSLLEELDRHANLLVLRTLSKLGLAGLRLGYLVAAKAWIAELEKLRLPYNINVLTQVTVEFALQHYATLEEQCSRILRDREDLYRKLCQLNSLRVWPSEANFLLCRVLGGDAPGLAGDLRRQGILIKLLHGSEPLLDQCIRISVGTPDENQQLLNALGYNRPIPEYP